jgi:uncharacterized membrane-anchored protein
MKYLQNRLSIILFICMTVTIPQLIFAGEAVAQATEDPQMTQEEIEYYTWVEGVLSGLNRIQGEVSLPNGIASLQVPDEFYYLSPADSEKVLVEIWGNPEGAGSDPDLDQVAAYGLGALVAGKLIAKTGFLAAGLLFLKKFGVVIILAAAALVRKLTTRKDKPVES